MVHLRKARAGSCNLGYTWPEDGSVVEVTPEHALGLLSIPFNDFTAVDAPEAAPAPQEPDEDRSVEEPAPAAEISEDPVPRKPPAKKTAAKKTPAPVEE